MSEAKKATARAHPNIALVKYWGKRDEARILPHQSSLSVTLSPLSIEATVSFEGSADRVEINGKEAHGKERQRVLGLIDSVRKPGGLGPVRVVTRGDFPAAAGLASSAAAFAALAISARAAAGLPRDVRQESILAREGSGSASRSIQGGVCIWRRGDLADGSDSYAEQLVSESHWPELRLLVCVVSDAEKEVSSRDGMRHTVETSPYYEAWVADAEVEVTRAAALIRARDLAALGTLAERNAWRMHATALAADPPVCYLRPSTLAILEQLSPARRRGLPVYFTLDAGPNPVLLTLADHESAVAGIAREAGAKDVVHCTPGGDAVVIDRHLF